MPGRGLSTTKKAIKNYVVLQPRRGRPQIQNPTGTTAILEKTNKQSNLSSALLRLNDGKFDPDIGRRYDRPEPVAAIAPVLSQVEGAAFA